MAEVGRTKSRTGRGYTRNPASEALEAVKRRAGHRPWDIKVIESTFEDDENCVEATHGPDLPLVGCLR